MTIQGKMIRCPAGHRLATSREGAWLLTKTWARVASVGNPAMIRWLGAGACVTPSVQVRQAYLGRTVTSLAHVNMRCRAVDDAQLGGNDVQPFAAVFSDLVRSLLLRHWSKRQWRRRNCRGRSGCQAQSFLQCGEDGGQVANGALECRPARPIARFGGTDFLFRLDLGQRDGQVLKRQLLLILGQFFRPLAMQSMVQLGDQLADSGLSSNHERQMHLPTDNFR